MIKLIFRREMRAFLANRILWSVFCVQPIAIIALMAVIGAQVKNAVSLQPDLLRDLISKQLSTFLVSFSVISVIHIVQRNATIEKTTGLIETLLTTPLTIRQIVLGKALQIGLLGYTAGLLSSLVNIGILLALTGHIEPLWGVRWYYWVFAFAGAPLTVYGLLVLIVAGALVFADSRVILLLFNAFGAGTLAFASANRNTSADWVAVVLLTTIGTICHCGWWWWAHAHPGRADTVDLTEEKVG